MPKRSNRGPSPKRLHSNLSELDLRLDSLRHDADSAVSRLAWSYVPADVKRLVHQRRGRPAPWASRLVAALLSADDSLAGANE